MRDPLARPPPLALSRKKLSAQIRTYFNELTGDSRGEEATRCPKASSTRDRALRTRPGDCSSRRAAPPRLHPQNCVGAILRGLRVAESETLPAAGGEDSHCLTERRCLVPVKSKSLRDSRRPQRQDESAIRILRSISAYSALKTNARPQLLTQPKRPQSQLVLRFGVLRYGLILQHT